VLFDGTAEAMIDRARGRVWVSDRPDARARLSWRTGLGHHRLIGDPPPEAILAEPALEDAYLLLIGRPSDADVSQAG
jgi:ABC-2 type transport system ATP-binding protein